MTNRNLWTAAVAAALAMTGCTHLTGGPSGTYVRDTMREYKFPKPCEELWVAALQNLAEQGFGLVGNDRVLVEQDKQGFITNFLNRGHATTKDDAGVYEAESDSNNERIRYIVKGRPADKNGCFVTYIEVIEDPADNTTKRHRDYDQELRLLSKVDPGAAAAILQAADKAN
jgi:hypothetical protein